MTTPENIEMYLLDRANTFNKKKFGEYSGLIYEGFSYGWLIPGFLDESRWDEPLEQRLEGTLFEEYLDEAVTLCVLDDEDEPAFDCGDCDDCNDCDNRDKCDAYSEHDEYAHETVEESFSRITDDIINRVKQKRKGNVICFLGTK